MPEISEVVKALTLITKEEEATTTDVLVIGLFFEKFNSLNNCFWQGYGYKIVSYQEFASQLPIKVSVRWLLNRFKKYVKWGLLIQAGGVPTKGFNAFRPTTQAMEYRLISVEDLLALDAQNSYGGASQ